MKNVISQLYEVAQELDKQGKYTYANEVTKVMKRVADFEAEKVPLDKTMDTQTRIPSFLEAIPQEGQEYALSTYDKDPENFDLTNATSIIYEASMEADDIENVLNRIQKTVERMNDSIRGPEIIKDTEEIKRRLRRMFYTIQANLVKSK